MSVVFFETINKIKNKSIKIKLTGEQKLMPDSVIELLLVVDIDSEEHKLKFKLDRTQDKPVLRITINEFRQAGCLLICGLTVAGAALDCWNKSRNWKEFKQCMEEKGHELSLTTIGCIANCSLQNQ